MKCKNQMQKLKFQWQYPHIQQEEKSQAFVPLSCHDNWAHTCSFRERNANKKFFYQTVPQKNNTNRSSLAAILYKQDLTAGIISLLLSLWHVKYALVIICKQSKKATEQNLLKTHCKKNQHLKPKKFMMDMGHHLRDC